MCMCGACPVVLPFLLVRFLFAAVLVAVWSSCFQLALKNGAKSCTRNFSSFLLSFPVLFFCTGELLRRARQRRLLAVSDLFFLFCFTL
jgi:hypothetical protein